MPDRAYISCDLKRFCNKILTGNPSAVSEYAVGKVAHDPLIIVFFIKNLFQSSVETRFLQKLRNR